MLEMRADDVREMLSRGAKMRHIAAFYGKAERAVAELIGGYFAQKPEHGRGIQLMREAEERAKVENLWKRYRSPTDARFDCPPIGRSALDRRGKSVEVESEDFIRANPCRKIAIEIGLIEA